MKFSEIDLCGSKLQTLSIECTYLLLELLYFIVAFTSRNLDPSFFCFYLLKGIQNTSKMLQIFFSSKVTRVIKLFIVSVYSYFLIWSAQTKTTLFFFFSATGWVKENKSFLLVEPCFQVIRFMETKLQFSFCKYVSICTVYTVLIRVILKFLYNLHSTHGGSNFWEKTTASGTKM